MTTSNGSSHASMRFSLDEVLSGILASVESDSFTDDHARLATMFDGLAKQYPLCAPLAAAVDPEAVQRVFDFLVSKNTLEHADGQYKVTATGRIQCMGSKKMLFNKSDGEQLAAAAQVFGTL